MCVWGEGIHWEDKEPLETQKQGEKRAVWTAHLRDEVTKSDLREEVEVIRAIKSR